MKKLLLTLNYVSTPAIRELQEQYLILESLPKKVWNPVFTIGIITFTCSMIFRGFFDAAFAVIPLALSTFMLFAGVWILSGNGTVVFDKTESNCYVIYKHLGYLQKIYVYPMTSIDKILFTLHGHSFLLQLLKDDGEVVNVARSNEKNQLLKAGVQVAAFLKIPMDQ